MFYGDKSVLFFKIKTFTTRAYTIIFLVCLNITQHNKNACLCFCNKNIRLAFYYFDVCMYLSHLWIARPVARYVSRRE